MSNIKKTSLILIFLVVWFYGLTLIGGAASEQKKPAVIVLYFSVSAVFIVVFFLVRLFRSVNDAYQECLDKPLKDFPDPEGEMEYIYKTMIPDMVKTGQMKLAKKMYKKMAEYAPESECTKKIYQKYPFLGIEEEDA